MRRICTLAALLTVALGFGADGARAAHIETPPADGAGAVTAVSVVPTDGRADVVIAVSGTVSVNHFTVENPDRIVVDISEARLGSFPRRYDGRPRGGITDIRFAQNRPGVVRVVVQMNSKLSYTVTRTSDAIRVAVSTTGEFAAWSSHPQATNVAEATRPAPTTPPATPPAVASRPTPPAATPPAAAATNPPATPPVVETPARISARLDTMPAVTQRPVASESAGFVGTPIDSVISRVGNRTVFTGGPRSPIVMASQQQSQQPRITVTYVNADISEVIAGFAERFNRTIILGSSVSGTVNAEINDQPWDVALKAILDAQGLAATEEASGIIVVDSYQNILRRQASEPLTTQMVNINYVTAGSLVETVRELLSKDCPETPPPAQGNQPGGQAGGPATYCLQRGSVAADSGTNSLLITEVASRMPNLLNYVRQLDVRTPQVNLKARIISVNRTQIEQLGLSYDLGSSVAYLNTLLPRPRPGSQDAVDNQEGRVLLGGEAIAGVANASRRFRNGAAINLLFTTAIGNYSLSAFLDALREQQLSDIQAEPSVTTLDNREARMMVGQETPVRVIDAGAAGQIGVPPRANVQFKETGIILTVTPHITSNRQIRMQISAEQSELRVIGGDLGFTIDKRNATTQVLVNDGETAVIGGLTQTQVTKVKSGIPLLSDLPMLGRLFSQSEMREEKRDLLILITPRILEPGEAIRPPGDGDR